MVVSICAPQHFIELSLKIYNILIVHVIDSVLLVDLVVNKLDILLCPTTL